MFISINDICIYMAVFVSFLLLKTTSVGRAEGLADGPADGLAKGLADGLDEGPAEGPAERPADGRGRPTSWQGADRRASRRTGPQSKIQI